MTLTGWGAATGGTAGSVVGLVTGALVGNGVPSLPPDPPDDHSRAEVSPLLARVLEIDASDELKLDMLQVIVCVATCNARKSFASDAVRIATINEVFGLSSAVLHDALRKKVDVVLSSHYDEHLLSRTLVRLMPFRSTLHALSLACIRAVLIGSPQLNEKQQSIALWLDAMAATLTDPVRA